MKIKEIEEAWKKCFTVGDVEVFAAHFVDPLIEIAKIAENECHSESMKKAFEELEKIK